jgi:hypothetical protein
MCRMKIEIKEELSQEMAKEIRKSLETSSPIPESSKTLVNIPVCVPLNHSVLYDEDSGPEYAPSYILPSTVRTCMELNYWLRRTIFKTGALQMETVA